MATVNFRIKGNTDPGNIRIRLKQGDRFDYEISTGLKSSLDHWSKSGQKVRNLASVTYKDEVNSKLRHLKTFIEEEYMNDLALGVEVSQQWLKGKVNEYFQRPSSDKEDSKYYLDSFIEDYIKESRGKIKMKLGRPVSNRTIEYYQMTQDKIIAFQQKNGQRLKFNDINIKFHQNFVNYLSTEQFLNPNTIGFYMSKLKLFLREAELKGLSVNPEYKSSDFYVPSNATKDIYLNEGEIQLIYELDLKNNERLENARDWLIIGVWTGLRVSDLLSLQKEDIKKSLIHITNMKTGIPVIIPLHIQVKDVLEKRDGDFPREISDQKFNDYIKTVCELAGISNLVEGSKMMAKKINSKKIYRKSFGKYPKHELVSSHICRRSFATNHYGKLDTLTIMKITGHKTEKQFIEYIKITPSEYAEKLENFWDRKVK